MPKRARKARKSQPRRLQNWLYLGAAAGVVIVIGLAVVLGGLSRAKESPLPQWLALAHPSVREAYAYAEVSQDSLSYIPCYCGCGDAAHGYHRSNYDCFIDGKTQEGATLYDQHGANCAMCVDIALVAKNMLGQGKSLKEVRAEVDRRYASLGPGTDTPPIP